MINNNLTYVNSTMDEIHELSSELYEAMIDVDKPGLLLAIKNLRRALSDIQKSYDDEL